MPTPPHSPESMTQSGFRVSRQFAALACFVLVAAGGALAIIYRQTAIADLHDMAERNNVALIQAFSNAFWPGTTEFVSSAHELDTETLRAHPETAALLQAVLAQTAGLPVLKVKIYDMGGLTVFSTDPSQIGDDKSGNAGYLSARLGAVASELTHRDTVSAFEQIIADRDVLSSYIPIVRRNGEIEGVFEIYYDVTELLARIEYTQLVMFAIVAVSFIIVYALLTADSKLAAAQAQWRSEEEQLRRDETSAENVAADQRLTIRLMKQWHKLRGNRRCPLASEFLSSIPPEFLPDCFIFESGKSLDEGRFSLGINIARISGITERSLLLAEVPGNTLLGAAIGSLEDALKGNPIADNGEFEDEIGQQYLYRAILLPMEDDEAEITQVICGAKCKARATKT